MPDPAPSLPTARPPAGSGKDASVAVTRIPGVLRLLGSRGLSSGASQMQAVALGWQVYALTGRPFSLGLIGLAQFLPVIALVFVAGHAVDRGDRRLIAAICQGAQAAVAGLLALLARGHAASPASLYLLAALAGAARAFEAPSLQAMLPGLVPASSFGRAAALGSSVFQTAAIAGPSLGGLLYGIGAPFAYGAAALAFAAAAVSTARLPRVVPAAGRPPPTLRSVFAGIGFIRANPAIAGAISLDLFAVLLGGATAMLPVYASGILHAGPFGLGLLRAAPALGALAVSLPLSRHPMTRRLGPRMFGAVALFGALTIVFGVSRSLPLSVAALAGLGGADVVSVVIRSTLIQLRTPDAMRGRVGAVTTVFIGSSNQLGEFESGTMATLVGTVPSVVLGGVGTLLVAAAGLAVFPALRRLDRIEPVE